MRIKEWTNGLGKIYTKTTILEGTIHLIKGTMKAIKVFFISIYWKHNFSNCGKNLSVYPKVKIDFPKNINLGNNISINESTYLKSENENSTIRMYDDVNIGKKVKIDYSGGIDIGKKTLISDEVEIHTHDHGTNPFSTPKYKKLRIEENVWIASRAIILPQVSIIGKNSIIGAGAIITKDVPANVIVAGNPAKIVKEIK